MSQQIVDQQITTLSTRPTRIEISLPALRHNLQETRRLTKAKIMPVVKANAYGHGIVKVAEFFAECPEVSALAVGFLEEGLLLRERGVTIPILVLGGIFNEQISQFLKHDLTITVSSLFKAQQVSDLATRRGGKARIHLKVDTGMERIGVHYYNALEFVTGVFRLPGLQVEGIYSHCARAEEVDDSFTLLQIERFNELLEKLKGYGYEFPLRHMANSAALMRHPEAHFDLVRPGLMLYGCHPGCVTQSVTDLHPALSLKSAVVFFKVVEENCGISYGHSHVTQSRTRIVTIPVGYGDGYPRALSNRSSVLLRGKRFPVVGNVCMDQFLVDLGRGGTGYNGDEVVLIGRQGNEIITVNQIADQAGTIPYEVLTQLNTRIPRVYHD